MKISFPEVFKSAFKSNISPYPYQLAIASNPWPQLIHIPTGMGKTAAVIISWLFKRLIDDPETPRRLVYCLPMRVLVEQTYRNACKWVDQVYDSENIPSNNKPSVYILMGGDIDTDWDRFPEKDAIIIGTQDMLLSRALNRGYAMSRFRWPVQFGLLNNDCLWVMDEIQLMGNGLATTTQLQAFRDNLGISLPVSSIWMSATLQKDWLNTVDYAEYAKNLDGIGISEDDLNEPSVNKLLNARKILKKADCPFDKPAKLADTISTLHKKGTRTIIVVNTVKRAIQIYEAIKQKKTKAELTLIHSRFRRPDRKMCIEKIFKEPDSEGSICISTQVIEAGVDISATTLITDLAPWASLVQRFGRCNRYGSDSNAAVYWIDIDLNKKGAELPYSVGELSLSAEKLSQLDDVSPNSLPSVDLEANYDHVIRRKDLIDLFDTTPDLSGLDIDISRFIRESEDNDCNVFWRDFTGNAPEDKEPAPAQDELCSVPVGDLKAQKDLRMWLWDHLEKRWVRSSSISPGMIFMLHKSDGCYHKEYGWTGKKGDVPDILKTALPASEGNDDDFQISKGWQSLLKHHDAVVDQLKKIASSCGLSEKHQKDIITAARWHDAGKAHDIFQEAMVGDPPEADQSIIWGKTARTAIAYRRKGFRHELASALAMLDSGLPDLVAFLAAAHHGKIRLSIRSLPHEKNPDDPELRFARGIWEGDVLRATDLGDGHRMPETKLELSYMEFGDGPKGASWLARMLALRDDPALGPFRLAFFEALLRTADWRASEKTESNNE